MKSPIVGTLLVRLLQCCVAGAIVVAVALFSMSIANGFADWPEIAYIKPFVFVSVVIGTVILLLVLIESIDCFFAGMRDVDVHYMLRKLNIIRWSSGILTAYLIAAFIVFWYATRLMHPTIIIIVALCCGIGIVSVVALTLLMHKLAKNIASI